MTTTGDETRTDTDTSQTEHTDETGDATPSAPRVDESTEDTSGTDDVAKWKALARKHETDLKKATKALDQLQKATQSDQERAVSEAEERGRASALSQIGHRLAAAELRAAGVPTDVIDDLNLAKFVDDAGEIDMDAVKATASKFAVKQKALLVPTGPRGGGGPDKPKSLGEAIAARVNKN